MWYSIMAYAVDVVDFFRLCWVVFGPIAMRVYRIEFVSLRFIIFAHGFFFGHFAHLST